MSRTHSRPMAALEPDAGFALESWGLAMSSLFTV
jgi:hypothetical protein